MTRQDFRNGCSWLGLLIVAIIVLVIVGAAIWGFGVLTSGVVGQGEQIKQINSASNRTFQYQHFFDLDATIRAQSVNVQSAKKDLADFDAQYPPSANESYSITQLRGQKQGSLTGLEQLCAANIQSYNNDAQEFTRDQFLSNKLPQSFNVNACDDPKLLPTSASGQ